MRVYFFVLMLVFPSVATIASVKQVERNTYSILIERHLGSGFIERNELIIVRTKNNWEANLFLNSNFLFKDRSEIGLFQLSKVNQIDPILTQLKPLADVVATENSSRYDIPHHQVKDSFRVFVNGNYLDPSSAHYPLAIRLLEVSWDLESWQAKRHIVYKNNNWLAYNKEKNLRKQLEPKKCTKLSKTTACYFPSFGLIYKK